MYIYMLLLLIGSSLFSKHSKATKTTETAGPSHTAVDLSLSSGGMGFLTEFIQHRLEETVADAVIPDFDFEESGFNVSVSGGHLDHFSPPEVLVELHPPKSLRAALQGGSFGVTAKWRIKKRPLDATGTVLVKSRPQKSTSFSFTVKTTTSPKGALDVNVTHCEVDVPVEAKFSKSILALALNAARKKIEDAIEDKIRSLTCSLIGDVYIKQAIDTIPTHFDITDHYDLEFHFRNVNVDLSDIDATIEADLIDELHDD